MALDESFDENDRVYDQGDFKIVINKGYDDSYSKLEITYVKSFFGKGFKISTTANGKHSSC